MSRTAGMVAGRQLGVISRKDSAKKPRKLLQWSLCLYLFIHLIKHVKLDFQLLSYLLTKNCFDLISITLVFNKKKIKYIFNQLFSENDYKVRLYILFWRVFVYWYIKAGTWEVWKISNTSTLLGGQQDVLGL